MDDKFEDAQKRYQGLMNCLFNDAMQQSVNKMHEDFRPILASIVPKPSPRVLEDISFATEAPEGAVCKLEEVQALQSAHGYETLCDTESDNPTVDKMYSSCRVAETAMNEYCAYQEYLEWKKGDHKSFTKEFPPKEIGFSGSAQKGKYNERKALYQKEIEESKETMDEMLYYYEKWEQNYRMHLWFLVIQDALVQSREMLKELRHAVYLFPNKFNYAASQICDQGC